ncbi:MAG: acylphosphatase [Lachnospiraceae bacterium]|nr:acylphosphatase [Lachnospiraceae bacterium]
MNVRKHIRFYGKVQGVGFRYHATYKARLLGLTGWVRNCYDGTVEMEVQGDAEAIAALLLYLHSQRFIQIKRMDEETIERKEEREFKEKW